MFFAKMEKPPQISKLIGLRVMEIIFNETIWRTHKFLIQNIPENNSNQELGMFLSL